MNIYNYISDFDNDIDLLEMVNIITLLEGEGSAESAARIIMQHMIKYKCNPNK